MQLEKVFQNFGLAGSMAEFLTLILVLLAVSVVFWFLIGRFRLHNFLINTYISLAMVDVLPQQAMLLGKNSQIIFFVVILIFLTLMNKFIFDIHQQGSGLAIWQVVAMSFLEVVLLASIVCSYLPSKDVLSFISRGSLVYFADPWWRVVWMIAPLAFLIFVKKRSY
jgi:hypothetical protein